MKSPLLIALSLISMPMLGVQSAQAWVERPADIHAFSRCLVAGGSAHELPDGRVACCMVHSCVICDQRSCVVRSSGPQHVDPGSGSGLNGGTYSNQTPGTVLQFGN